MITDQKLLLIIMDGWGLQPNKENNPILQAKTPVIDTLMAAQPNFMTLQASGETVGLPWGEMGNSEVGHINIGSGRVVLSDFTQINDSIKNGSFFKNPVLIDAIKNSSENKSAFHIIGLASDSGVHGDYHYILACAKQAVVAGLEPIIHLITDGRDTAPKVALKFVKKIEDELNKIGHCKIASISGRYYAMDRDGRWDRTSAVYQALVDGEAQTASSAQEAIESSYKDGKSDEFIVPTLIGDKNLIKNKDTVIFTNFRADRAIQLTKYFIDKTFSIYKRDYLDKLFFVTMTQYQHDLGAQAMFSVVTLNNPNSNPLTQPLAQVISENGLKQLHAAESEKYAHVTYFFNTGHKEEFKGEEWLIVPSPKVKTYDMQPKMSAVTLTEKFIEKWNQIQPSFGVLNFANADMVGHTGDLKATIEAVECIDTQIGKIVKELCNQGVNIIITADHGNAEQIKNLESGFVDKEHSINPVPFIFVGTDLWNSIKENGFKSIDESARSDFASMPPVGLLADVAPTVLDVLKLKQPAEMQGHSLLGING